MGDRWGRDGPPQEAYSRVSDPERYRALHEIGRDLLDELQRDYDVTREADVEPDPHDGSSAVVIRLRPTDPASSPLALVFDGFPGLMLRMGRDDKAHVPECGCDACDETVEDCVQRLRQYAEAVTAGTFGERLVRGRTWGHERWYETDDAAWSGSQPIDDVRLAELRTALGGDQIGWTAWARRSVSDTT